MMVRRLVLTAVLVLMLMGVQTLWAAGSTEDAPAASATGTNGSVATTTSGTTPATPAPSAVPTVNPAAPAAPATTEAVPFAEATPAATSETAPAHPVEGQANSPGVAPVTAAAPAQGTTPGAVQAEAQSGGAAPVPTASSAIPPATTAPATATASESSPQPAAQGADGKVDAATDASSVDTSADDSDNQNAASTLDLLNEDDHLDQAQDNGANDNTAGDSADAVEPSSPDTAGQGDSGESDAAAALTPPSDTAAPESDAAVSTGQELFPSSPGIEKQKAFWIKIFTKYNSHQGVLHDGRIALPVYEALDLTGMRYRAQRRYVRQRKRELALRLRSLADAVEHGRTLDAAEQALLAKLPPDSTPREMIEYSHNLRFQRGLADRFREGLIRSGALLEPMKQILVEHKVPPDLVYLPHVESSFNNATRSKYGAAGIWQFTRSTGRHYMMVGYEVDERLDPIIASEAAAKFLRQNYEHLGNWPLAITAYNHGPQSMEHITRRMHTHDLGVLIQHYNGRLFKFASKNFYAEFLAAREVAKNYQPYFGKLTLEPTLQFDEVDLPSYVGAEVVAHTLGIDEDVLHKLNPALRGPIWSGSKYIPPGYSLRIPASKDPAKLLAAIPKDDLHDKQKRSVYVRVARGDTLYDIGRRNGISWRVIAAANNIDSYHRLMPGQKLILPWKGATLPPDAVAQSKPNRPAKPLAAEKVVERIPVTASTPAAAPWRGGVPSGVPGEPLAERFQDLQVQNYDAKRKRGEIVAAYGETVGSYATWANVTTGEVRHVNDMSSRSVLRPGETYTIPLDAVTPQQFEERRMSFHRDREQSFFAENDIKEKVKIEVRRGQTPWAIAQDNNVPMWLFYRENPQLLTEPLRVGMEVILPIVQAGSPVGR